MYNLSVCAVVRNEMSYISEWIEFHLLQGVEHFFLYYNHPPDGSGTADLTICLLKDYEATGLVTVVLWPENPPQFTAYNNCLETFGKTSKWIAFLDCDEFLYSPTLNGLQKAIEHVAHKSKSPVGGIGVHWVFFGSNNEKEADGRLCIERFNKRARDVDRHVKSIVRPDVTIRVGKDPHHFIFKIGYQAIEENGKSLPIHYALTEGGTANVLRIAHFHTKSYAEYVKRKSENPDPGHGRFPDRERIDVQFAAFDLNQIKDLSLFRYIKQVKQNIEDRKKL